MASVGSVELAVSLGLDQLLRDADQARLILQRQLQDQEINLNLVTGPASQQLAQLAAQIAAAKAAATEDNGAAAEFQRQAALLQEMTRYKQELAEIEGAGFSDEDLQTAKAMAAELNKLNLDRIQREFDELQDRIAETERASNTFIGQLNQKVQAFSQTIEEASLYSQALSQVSGQLLAAGQQINAFTTQAAQAAIAFDTARAKVSTLSDDAAALAQQSRDLAAELGFQANSTDLLNASYDVLSSGIEDTADVAKVLKASTQGALGGFSDVGTVSDAITTLISAYKSMGMSANDATRIVDILAQTQDKGKITIGEYASQVGQIASIAAQAGIGLEEMSAAVATATAKGVPASSAISGTRQAIVNLLKPTNEAQTLLEQFGISNATAALKSEGLVGILQRLRDQGATTDQLSKIFSDVDALATVATLAGENLGDFQKNLDAMSNAAGTAADAADKVANSMQGQLNAAMNQANEALIDLGNGVAKAVVPLLAALTTLIELFNELPDPVKEAVGLTIAMAGGAVTLAGALAGVAAVLPVVKAGFTLMTGSAVAAAPALAALLPLLTAIAVGVAAIKFVLFVRELGDANQAIEAASQQIEASSNAAMGAANRTAGMIRSLNQARQEGRSLTQQEVADAQRLVEANKTRIAQLKEDLALAQALPAASDEQKQAQANLIQQTEQSIKALEGQNKQLEGSIATSTAAAKANKALEVTVESVGESYQKSTAQLEAANKLRLAEITEATAQGLLTEEQAREETLKAEKDFLNARLTLSQTKLSELKALQESTTDPAKLKEIGQQILQTEQEIADGRLQLAQKSAEERRAAEEKALANLERSIQQAQQRIARSQGERTLGVRQQQETGAIDEQEAAEQIAEIEQDGIAETMRIRQEELAQVRALKEQRVLSAEEAAEREAAILQELSDLAVLGVEAEIAAQQRLLDAIAEKAAESAELFEVAQTDRITAVRRAQLAGVTSEEEAARQIAQINRDTAAENLRIKQQELAQIAQLRSSGELSIAEAAQREQELIGEIADLRQATVEADLELQEQARQATIARYDEELARIQTAAEAKQGANQIEISGLQTQSSLLSAQLSLFQAQTALTQQRLENAIKEAEAQGRTGEAERLRKQLLDEQKRAQEEQFRIELQQLKLKQEQNALELENAQIQAQIAATEAQIQIQQAQASGATAQEIANLQTIADLRQRQLAALGRQAAAQQQINALEEQALRTQQQRNREAVAAERQSASQASSSRGGGGMSVFNPGGGGGSSDSGRPSTVLGGKPPSVMQVTDQLTNLARNGSLADAFKIASLNLGLKTGFTSVGEVGARVGASNSGEILGKLDQLIAATKEAAGRPNLSISNVNDLGMAGQIYGDISRSGLRGAGL